MQEKRKTENEPKLKKSAETETETGSLSKAHGANVA